jgi:hypothetical protein
MCNHSFIAATSFDDLNSPSYFDGNGEFHGDPTAETSYYSSTGNELDEHDNVFSCPEGELFGPPRKDFSSEHSDTPTGSNSNVSYLPHGGMFRVRHDSDVYSHRMDSTVKLDHGKAEYGNSFTYYLP